MTVLVRFALLAAVLGFTAPAFASNEQQQMPQQPQAQEENKAGHDGKSEASAEEKEEAKKPVTEQK